MAARVLAGLVFAAAIIALVWAVIAGQPAIYLMALGFGLYSALLFVRSRARFRAADRAHKTDNNV